MTDSDLQRFRDWFGRYTHSFYTGNEDDRKNISLKIEHTRNVCRLIIRIAKEETTDRDTLLLAETAALLHDAFP
jgi:HD superfamily phosphodiesterase